MSTTVKDHTNVKVTEFGIDHAEILAEDEKVATEEDIPTSAFKDMPRKQALWVFRRAVLYSLLVAWAALMDGYLISSAPILPCSRLLGTDVGLVPGSIVANKYFITQFCTVGTGGACALDSVYVGAWTAVQSVGQIIGEPSRGRP